MRSIAAALFLFVSLLAQGAGSGALFAVDGEVFTRKFVGAPPNQDQLIEYVREAESFDSWTRLIGLRYQRLPGVGNEPKQAAAVLAQVVKSKDPQSQSRVIVNEQTNEALIDFLMRSPDGEF